MKKQILTLLAIGSIAGSVFAETMSFDFKDPKGVNNATFSLDAPLEAINGSANGVTGTVSFDPAHPEKTTGKLVVDAKSLHVPNPMMKEHLHGNQWMDTAKFGEITFEAKSLKNVKTSGDNTTADATGTMTMKGVTKDMTVPIKLTYLKDKLGLRVPSMKGDLLVIRADFTIQRADFGVNPGAPTDKVSETIELKLSVAGAAPKG